MDVIEKAGNKIVPYVKLIEKGLLKAPISLHLLITDWCVNRCNMCGHWKTENKKELDMAIIEEIWWTANNFGIESICLTGGDPISHKSFDEILKLPRHFDLGIITSGNFKSGFDYDLLKDLAFVRFSVDSLEEQTYQEIRGRCNLSEVLEKIDIVFTVNKNVGINFTMQKLNYREIRDMIRWVYSKNYKRLIAYPVHGNPELELTKEEMGFVVNEISSSMKYWTRISENNMAFLYQNFLGNVNFKKPHEECPCIINKIHVAIGADGRVFPCEVVADDTDSYGSRDVVLGNIYEQNLIHIWKMHYNKEFVSEKCKICFSRYLPINESYDKNKGKNIFI